MSVSLKSLSKPKAATPAKWGKTNNRAIYGSERWKNISRRYRREHPLCVLCSAPSEMTDHIVPINSGGDVWKESNFQALCNRCHARKTRREK